MDKADRRTGNIPFEIADFRLTSFGLRLTKSISPALTAMLLYTLTLLSAPNAQAELGLDWTQATAAAAFSPRTGQTSVVFNGKMWVIGGINFPLGVFYNDIWNSSDGTSWTQVTAAASFSPRAFHTSVVFNNKIWVIGGRGAAGFSNDVWSSPDGATWTRETSAAAFSPRNLHTSVVFQNKIWVIAGLTTDGGVNDVWSSPNGVDWTNVTPAAAFPGRVRHTSVVFKNKLWVIGGMTDTVLNDVWSSPDGITWTEMTDAAQFSARARQTSIVLNNRIWVIAGLDNLSPFIFKHDVWSSEDGIAWTRSTSSAPFPSRARHTSVVFNDKMWVIAGDGTDSTTDTAAPLHDVWYSAFPSPVRDAHLVSNSIPSAMTPGSLTTAFIYMQNTGSETWTNADDFKLAVIKDDAHLIAGTRFYTIPDHPIPMWSGNVYEIPITAPAQPGNATLQLRMVKEFVEFFGETVTAEITFGSNSTKDWSLYQ